MTAHQAVATGASCCRAEERPALLIVVVQWFGERCAQAMPHVTLSRAIVWFMWTAPPLAPRPAPPYSRCVRTHVRPAGVTLLEIVVALAVLGVGILTLADATAAMQRRVMREAWRMRAAELLVSRVESLTATPCDTLAGGTRVLPGMSERWEVALEPPLARVHAEVEVTALSPPVTLELPATLWCGRG